MREKVGYFDLLRVVGAIAVVVIHVLGPYRDQFGVLPDWQWITAITFNSFSRWAVPVFIMITGALMLSDRRPIEWRYFLKKRLAKVLIPFLVWSVFYAFLSAFSLREINFSITWELLINMPFDETYYHLGFFYYFIPLYFIIPFFHWLVRRIEPEKIKTIIMLWLLSCALFLYRIDGPWNVQYILYAGYLLFGYALYQYKWPWFSLLVPLTIVSLFVTDYIVISKSFIADEYMVGRWFSYKTLNIVIIAGGVFVFCRYINDKFGDRTRYNLGVLSRYSFGVYLLHPIFLWPLRHYDLYFANPLIAIPVWTVIAASFALGASWLLSRSPKTAWLVP